MTFAQNLTVIDWGMIVVGSSVAFQTTQNARTSWPTLVIANCTKCWFKIADKVWVISLFTFAFKEYFYWQFMLYE